MDGHGRLFVSGALGARLESYTAVTMRADPTRCDAGRRRRSPARRRAAQCSRRRCGRRALRALATGGRCRRGGRVDRRRSGRRHSRGLPAAGAGGPGATGLRAGLRPPEALPPALEGRDLVVTGVVASLPQAGAAGWRFRLDVEDALADGRPVEVPGSIALGWYRGAHEDAALLQPGAAARRAALATSACACASRMATPTAWLRLRAVPLRAGRARHRLHVRDTPPPVLVTADRRPSGRPAAPGSCATRSSVRGRTGRRGILAALAVGRPGGHRPRRLGPVPQHRHRPPDVDQRPACDDVRLARRPLACGWRGGAARGRCCGCPRRWRRAGRRGGGAGLRGVRRLGRPGAAHGADAARRGGASSSGRHWPWAHVLAQPRWR